MHVSMCSLCVCLLVWAWHMRYEWNSITCFNSALACRLFDRIYFGQRQHYAIAVFKCFSVNNASSIELITVHWKVFLCWRFLKCISLLCKCVGLNTNTCHSLFFEHLKGYTQVIWIWLSDVFVTHTHHMCVV